MDLVWHFLYVCFIDNQSLEELEEEHSNEALSADDGGYYNISEVTMFIKIDELQRVISDKNTGEIKPFLSEYKVCWHWHNLQINNNRPIDNIFKPGKNFLSVLLKTSMHKTVWDTIFSCLTETSRWKLCYMYGSTTARKCCQEQI